MLQKNACDIKGRSKPPAKPAVLTAAERRFIFSI